MTLVDARDCTLSGGVFGAELLVLCQQFDVLLALGDERVDGEWHEETYASSHNGAEEELFSFH